MNSSQAELEPVRRAQARARSSRWRLRRKTSSASPSGSLSAKRRVALRYSAAEKSSRETLQREALDWACSQARSEECAERNWWRPVRVSCDIGFPASFLD